MTLTDLSPAMLDVSQTINPECEHIQGDMRTLRLGPEFDAVMYLTTESDLHEAIEAAYAHCRPSGAVYIQPDHVLETFTPFTQHGGHDGRGRSLRYLMWATDHPVPTDTMYTVDFAYLLRDADGVRVEHVRHFYGLDPQATWLRLLEEAGVHPGTLNGPDQTTVFSGYRAQQ